MFYDSGVEVQTLVDSKNLATCEHTWMRRNE